MRAVFTGIIAAAAYWILIVTFLAMAMPTRSQVEAYIDAAHSAPAISAVVAEPIAG